MAAVDPCRLLSSFNKSGVFSIPVVGDAFERVFGSKFLGTPSMQAHKSPFPMVAEFFGRVANAGPSTRGEIEGVAVADSAYDYATYYRDYAKQLSGFSVGQFNKANGMSDKESAVNSIKNFTQKYTQERNITEKEFGEEVRSIMNTEGYKSDTPEAHAVADKLHEFYDIMGRDLFKAMGKEGTFLEPRTAWRYLPQNYNVEAMINNEGSWIDLTVQEYMRQDKMITDFEAPIKQAEAQILSLRERVKVAGTINKDSPAHKDARNQLKSARGLLQRQQDQMIKTVRDENKYHILLTDRVMFDSEEAKELKGILEPVTKTKNLYKKENAAYEKIEAKFNSLDKESRSLESRQTRALESEAPDAGLIAKRQARIDELLAGRDARSKELKAAKEKAEKAERAMNDAEEKVQDDAYAGRINQKYFKRDGNKIKFHDPMSKPKFRTPFVNSTDMTLTARQVFNSITNQSPQDLIMGVFGHIDPEVNPGAHFLKSRSHLIDSEVYNSAGFLDPDVSKSATAYAATVGRIIGFKRAFPEYADGIGMEGILADLEAYHLGRKVNLKTKEGTPEGNKERTKLNKEYKDAKSFLSDTYNTYMGTYSTGKPDTVRRLTIAKNLVASSKLGSVLVYQLSELGAILMKTSIMPYFGQGMKPLVKSLFTMGKGIEAEAFKANASNAYLATYTVRNGYAQQMIESDMMTSPPLGGRVANATATLAHQSGNFFGTNFVANINERWMASSFQSEVMQAMYAHANGTLSKSNQIKMARYGLDVEKESAGFIKNFERSEGWTKDGGHQSLYWTWDDKAASDRMAMSIRRAVNDAVVNGNVFTNPYWAQSPFGSTLFMFHGWAYGSLNKYTIPLMQRVSADNMLGLTTMVGLSMFADPLLRIIHGKEMYDDDATWYSEAYKGLDYSGILGPYAGWIQDVNNMLGGNIIPHAQTERAKGREPGLSAIGGPIIGYGGDALKTLAHAVKGDATQGDAGRFFRMLPGSSSVAVPQALIYKFIENSGLPQTRAQAEPYDWRKTLSGQQ